MQDYPTLRLCHHYLQNTRISGQLPPIKDNSLKLLFATKTFNALVTSSYRIDGKFDAEVGPSTVNFRLDEMSEYENAVTTQVYIDKESWDDAIELAKNEHAVQLQTYNNVYQLRQVRSIFYSPTTYILCRSISAFVDDHTAQPLTIFTNTNFDDGCDKTESDRKICSLLFKVLALQAIKHQYDVVITRKSIIKLHSSTKDDKKVKKKILQNIVNLFDKDAGDNEDSGTIPKVPQNLQIGSGMTVLHVICWAKYK